MNTRKLLHRPTLCVILMVVILCGYGGIDAQPRSGDWTVSTDFGEFVFTVDSTGTHITKLITTFSSFSCGGVIQNGTITSAVSPGWPISNSQFTIDKSVNPSGTISLSIDGTFTEKGDGASGTWSINVSGTICSGSWELDTCSDDPLTLSWVQNLINNPFDPYCNECLTFSQARWNEKDVFIFNWEASSCGFTDLGFTTIYNCAGDTIQHCYTSIAGLQCEQDSMIIQDSLTDVQNLWQCTPFTFPRCSSDPDSILNMTWLKDTLANSSDLCDASAPGGNGRTFIYIHVIDTNIIIELRTTCADVIRRFYDCQGNSIYSCMSISESSIINCDLPFLPPLMLVNSYGIVNRLQLFPSRPLIVLLMCILPLSLIISQFKPSSLIRGHSLFIMGLVKF